MEQTAQFVQAWIKQATQSQRESRSHMTVSITLLSSLRSQWQWRLLRVAVAGQIDTYLEDSRARF